MKVVLEWKYCDQCDQYYLECPKCGNNACNGMDGLDGKCDVCPAVYDIQGKIPYPHELPHPPL